MCGLCGPTERMTHWTAVSSLALIRCCNPRLTPASSESMKRRQTHCSRVHIKSISLGGATQAHPVTLTSLSSSYCGSRLGWMIVVITGIFLLDVIWLNCPFATVNVTFKASRSSPPFNYGLFKAGDPPCGCGTNQS